MKESRGIKGAWNSLESRKMSLHHNLDYFPFAWCWPFEHHNANSLRHSCKNADRALSATHMLPPSLTDFMMFTVPPPHVPFPPPLPLFSSLPSRSPLALCHLLSGISSRLTGLAVTLDFKELLHSSVTHQKERAIQRCAKREGGDEEWVYKKEEKKRVCFGGAGDKCMKRGHERERGSALDRGRPWESQKQKKGHAPTHPHTHTESLSALKQTVSHLFSILLGVCRCLVHISFHRFLSISVFSLCLFFFVFSFFSFEPAVQRGRRVPFLL